jgi:APA family basic amino acid/polyamine antiporter
MSTSPEPRAKLSADNAAPTLARRIGLFDATMVVMGGIIGAGIFMNPYVVARQVHRPLLIVGAWAVGGAIALLGAFVWAELAAARPDVGGQYAYLRDAYHPLLGFLYGWVLLLVIQTGGMAAVAVTFARYFLELTHWPLTDGAVAFVALTLLTIVNCAGIRPGTKIQSTLTVMKIGAIAALVAAGLAFAVRPHTSFGTLTSSGRPLISSSGSFSDFLAAMVPVLFAFGGWQTANFIAGEIKVPRRNLPRALLLGVLGVIALYVAVNLACVWVLGASGLAATTTPASAVMRGVWGETGAKVIALGIAVSALGFLSQSILTAPRVYFAMAQDGAFFRSVGHVNPRTRVPDVAIVLQSVWTIVIALSGRYEQILNYVTSMDWLFFGLTAGTVFVFRRRSASAVNAGGRSDGFHTPGHPVTTLLFIVAAAAVVFNTVYRYPANTLLGFIILLAGVPVYFIWRRSGRIIDHECE